MVRAILDGRKTVTRRVVKPQPLWVADPSVPFKTHDADPKGIIYCPYGKPGDRLWVREAWQYYDWNKEGEPCIRFASDNTTAWPNPSPDEWADRLVDVWEVLSRDENYSIDNRARDRRWRPSIHMPRWASRITLEIVSVRVERLQDISEEDAAAEGIYRESEDEIPFNGPWYINAGDSQGYATAKSCYAALWDSINGEGSWEKNPWVWVISFRRVVE